MERLLSMFSYGYMVRAFIAGILVAVIVSLIGNIMVHKRLSMIGDSLAHTSLAGVAIGLVAGWNPIVGAILACIVGAFFIEGIRKRLGVHSEMAVAVVLSAGVGIAGLMSGFVKSGSDFSSFLFGSVIATSTEEVIMIAAVAAIVISLFIALYRKIFLISFDEESARLLGIRTNLVNALITFLTALSVAVSARIVGSLIISSLMVVPVAASSMIARSYRMQIVMSVVFSLVATIPGLILSFLFGLKPGASICLLSVMIFIVCTVIKALNNKKA